MLHLSELARRCAEETERFFAGRGHDSQFCFELFRQAIVEGDAAAWDLVYRQSESLVTGWVVRHTALEASGEAAPYFVNRAFEKMWAALTPEKFRDFPDLKFLLRYLQMCVHSVLMDHLRLAEQAAAVTSLDALDA